MKPITLQKDVIAAALRDAKAEGWRQGREDCAQYVEGVNVLGEHAGMTAVENMNFLLENTADELRALAEPSWVSVWWDEDNADALERAMLDEFSSGALEELGAWLLRCPQPVANVLGISTERRANNASVRAFTPLGCICPPTSERTCQNPICPRKPPTGSDRENAI